MGRGFGALTTAQDSAIGAAVGSVIPGLGTTIGAGVGTIVGEAISYFTSAGAARNASRQSQVTFFAAAAVLGSPVAVQYILGGIINCVASEVAMFQAAAVTVQEKAPDVWAAGVAAGPLWDPSSFPAMQLAVNENLTALAQGATSSTSLVTSNTASSAAVTVSPLVLAAFLGGAFLLLRRPS